MHFKSMPYAVGRLVMNGILASVGSCATKLVSSGSVGDTGGTFRIPKRTLRILPWVPRQLPALV